MDSMEEFRIGGGYRDGDRVRSTKWSMDGTVRFVDGVAEVRWDGSFVADELDLVAAHIVKL